jgi:hypothetical protein
VPGRSTRQFTVHSAKLSDNPPLVLMAGSVDASAPQDPDPQIQTIGTPVLLVANYHQSHFALSDRVVWKVERYSGDGKDGPSVEAASPNPLPTLTPDPHDGAKATLFTDAVGTFTIYAAIDHDGTGVLTEADKKQAVCLNIVLIKASFLQNQHQFSSDLTWPGHVWTGVRDGDFVITLRETGRQPAPLVLKTEVHLIGGQRLSRFGESRGGVGE